MNADQTGFELESYGSLEEYERANETHTVSSLPPTVRADVSELELGDRIAGPSGQPVTITAVGDMLWQDPFGRVSRDVWATDDETGDPLRLQIKPGVPIELLPTKES